MSSALTGRTDFHGRFPTLYMGLRANQGNNFQGTFPRLLREAPHKLRDKPVPSSHGHGAAFSAPDRAPINRQSPRRRLLRGLIDGALWRSSAQPCARKPRNVSCVEGGLAFSLMLHRSRTFILFSSLKTIRQFYLLHSLSPVLCF